MADDIYEVALRFTQDKPDKLRQGVWTGKVARRIIESEFKVKPSVDNGDEDIRYKTDDARLFAHLMAIAHQHSNGGWFCVQPMPEGVPVYHLDEFGRANYDGTATG